MQVRRSFESGHVSVSDLARKCGVTRQTAWKAIQRRGRVKKESEPAPTMAASSAPNEPPAAPLASSDPHSAAASLAPTKTLSPEEAWAAKFEQHERMRADMAEKAWNALAGIYLMFMGRANQLIKSAPEGATSATALNTAVRLVDAAHTGLQNLGIWARPAEEERSTKLVIEVMTDEQAAEIRRKVEENAAGAWDDAPSEQPARAAAQAASEAAVNGVVSPRFVLREVIPSEAAAFEPWLNVLAHRSGRVYLRQIAEALGGTGTGDAAAIIIEILQLTGRNPEKLRALAA